MKKVFSFSFILSCLMVMTSCYKETDYDWVDSTTHVFDYWSPTHVNIFYTNTDGDALFDYTDAAKCPVISDEELTATEVDSVRKTLTYTQGSSYSTYTLTGYNIINADGAVIGFLYFDSSYSIPCLIPYCHVDNTGTTTTYIYTYDSDGNISVDALVGKYHYAQEDDHWLVEATKMTLNGNEVWAGSGTEVGVVMKK